VIEADERIGASGEVLTPLDTGDSRRTSPPLRARGIESVAIVFMHGHAHPAHERAAAALVARAAGFDRGVRLARGFAAAAAGRARRHDRGGRLPHAAAGALRSPLPRGARAGHGGARLQFMQSHGGLCAPEAFRGANALLSGPAGGLVGMARAAEALGRTRLIGFDMGGTSTDVALYDGAYPRRYDSSVAGLRLQVPMMNIHTVAAGGGSVLRFAAGRLQVGPDSAGADPGPASYRRGGPLTVTDIHVLLGRIRPRRFRPCSARAATSRSTWSGPGASPRWRPRWRRKRASVRTPEALAEGFLQVAVESMAQAIRHVSVRLGHDAADYALFCFGGAAGQHACRVAEALGIREVLVHPLAGVLSAWGIGLADMRVLLRRGVERPLGAWPRRGTRGRGRRGSAPRRVERLAAQGVAAAGASAWSSARS
jgi:5-oxoprolinase (ATP-hydrolysing)